MPVLDRIQLRRDTAANWASVNPILANGEIGYEEDTGKAKIGNGVTAWNGRPYFDPGGFVSPLTTKGDLYTRSGSGDTRLAVGADNTLPVADASQSVGIKWAKVGEAMIALTDVTTGDVSSTKHGFAPKSPGDPTKFLNGDTTPAYTAISGAALALTDVTTNDVSTSKHGFAPKGPGTTRKFLRDDGGYQYVPIPVANTITDLNTIYNNAPPDGAPGIIRLRPTTGLNGAVTLPVATITVRDTSEMPSSGTISVGGQSVTYTGKTATTFTGCSGGTGTIADNSPVILTAGSPASGLYDRIELTYSATMSAWISPERNVHAFGNQQGPNPGAPATTWTVGWITAPFAVTMKWRALDAAGLKPQVRVLGVMGATGGGTFSLQSSPAFGALNASDSGTGSITHNGQDTTAAGPTGQITNANCWVPGSNWGSIPGGYTVKDYFVPDVALFQGTTGAVNLRSADFAVRWAG